MTAKNIRIVYSIMPRKNTQKRRLSKRKQRKDKPRRKTRGGSGAASYMIQAAGNMGEQVGHNGVLSYRLPQSGGAGAADYMVKVAGDMQNQHGANGLLKYTPVQAGGGDTPAAQAAGLANHLNQMGGVGAPMAVPVVLMLANQVAPKMLRGLRGGTQVPVNTPVPANTVNHIDPFEEEEEREHHTIFGVNPRPTPSAEETDPTLSTEQTGGGMLGTIAVPAALVLASNYVGKRSRRAALKQNRYTRKRGGSSVSPHIEWLERNIKRIDNELSLPVLTINTPNRLQDLISFRKLLNTVRAALSVLYNGESNPGANGFTELAENIKSKYDDELNRPITEYVFKGSNITPPTMGAIYGFIGVATRKLGELRNIDSVKYSKIIDVGKEGRPPRVEPNQVVIDPVSDANIISVNEDNEPF